jgi:hypothetical protein
LNQAPSVLSLGRKTPTTVPYYPPSVAAQNLIHAKSLYPPHWSEPLLFATGHHRLTQTELANSGG